MFANTTTFPLYILIREYPTNVDNKVIDQSNSEYNTMDSATLRKYGVFVPAGHKFPVISVSSKNVDVMFVCFEHGKKIFTTRNIGLYCSSLSPGFVLNIY